MRTVVVIHPSLKGIGLRQPEVFSAEAIDRLDEGMLSGMDRKELVAFSADFFCFICRLRSAKGRMVHENKRLWTEGIRTGTGWRRAAKNRIQPGIESVSVNSTSDYWCS